MARDTADDWRHIAETEPWFGVLSAPEFLNANLRQEGRDKLYAQGVSEMATVVTTLTDLYGDFRPRIGLDFGTGLGRLAMPMAGICEHVYGLDVAPAMLEEAARQSEQRGVPNVTYLERLPADVRVDWINSYIAFQHIAPPRGQQLLEGLVERLNQGGILSVHLTYAHDHRDTTLLQQEVGAYRFDGETMTVLAHRERGLGLMSMFDYDLNKVLYALVSRGVRAVSLHATDHGGVHGFWIFGRKG